MTSAPFRDSEYQNPDLPGSLVGAFRAWQALTASGRTRDLQRLAFTLSCPDADSAHKVAWFLDQRPICEATKVTRIDRDGREEWHIIGTTRQEVQSLTNLERLFTWLRVVAINYQVDLRVVSL